MRHNGTKKQSQQVLMELAEKSGKGLEFAKKTILAEKIQYVKLRDALEYYLSTWNDITHPGLFAAAYEAVGGDLKDAASAQASLALIAASFDIHDDIIDKSILKHAEQTVFGKFGEEIALLLGDAFLVEGFSLFFISIEKLGKERADILNVMKQALYEFGNAHALELRLKKSVHAQPEEYLEIIKMKAASIEGDMRIGAMIAGGTKKETDALARYGRILGTLAMLREEFVDVFDLEELHQRASSEYMPLPVLYALHDSRSARANIQKIIDKGITKKNIDGLIEIVFKTKTVGNLKEYMRELVTEASELTTIVRNKEAAQQLRSYVSSTLEDL